ncbi:MAG: GDP-mannose 4,6-dehydratase [Candidatus Aenigmarchaeota archaeon]|nr:GDP-mannose 4,6-dehydratase [Candidatus Aenigmarchaeota archaeon]
MILVTGCSGFIGTHLLRALGPRAVGIDVRPPRVEGVRFHHADIQDTAAIAEIIRAEHVTRVVHLAALSDIRGSTNADSYMDINIRALANLLEACKGLKQFVFASSSAVYGGNRHPPFAETAELEPLSIYGITKRTGEMLCHYYFKKYGLPCVSLRFFTVYGEGGRDDQAVRTFTRLISEGQPIRRFGDGQSSRDYIHVSDVVSGIQACLDVGVGGEVINLGTGRSVSLNTLIDLIGAALGKRPVIEPVQDITENVETTCADVAKARRVLGWTPQVSIEEGIARFVRWYQASRE